MLIRPRLTDHFGIHKSQVELDFVIQFLDEDIPALQLAEDGANLDQTIAWLKAAYTKLDAAIDQRYAMQGREILNDSGRDFGTAHIK